MAGIFGARNAREVATAPIADDIWKARWAGFQRVIQTIIDTNAALAAGRAGAGGDPTAPYFRSLLRNLECFTGQHYLRFTEAESPQPRPFSREAALTATFNQVANDLSVISHAWRQRHVAEFRDPLAVADALARECVEVAVQAKLFREDSADIARLSQPVEPRPIVLCYFQKHPAIRMMPYSPIALVGIPFEAYFEAGKGLDANAAKAMLAVVHEVGHIVFWKGHSQADKAKFGCCLNRKLQRDSMLSSWTGDGAEQIVADAFCAQAAGVAIALTAQERAKSRQLERYYATAARYQVLPEIRPETSLYVLANFADPSHTINQKFQAAAEYWQGVWDEARKRLLNGTTALNLPDGQATVGLKSAQAELQAAVKEAAGRLKVHLLGSGGDADALRNVYEFLDVSQYADSDRVLEQWRKYLESLPPVPAVDVETQLGRFFAGAGAPVECASWDDGRYSSWFEVLETQENAQPPLIADSSYGENRKWFTRLYAGGWVTESPGNSGGMPPPKI